MTRPGGWPSTAPGSYAGRKGGTYTPGCRLTRVTTSPPASILILPSGERKKTLLRSSRAPAAYIADNTLPDHGMVVNPFPIAFDQVEITVSVNLLFPDKSHFSSKIKRRGIFPRLVFSRRLWTSPEYRRRRPKITYNCNGQKSSCQVDETDFMAKLATTRYPVIEAILTCNGC